MELTYCVWASSPFRPRGEVWVFACKEATRTDRAQSLATTAYALANVPHLLPCRPALTRTLHRHVPPCA
eukprot:scaffold74536_cov73-Phaeocystis_antarctica.AAC.2